FRFRGSRKDDKACACFDVLREINTLPEGACALEHQIDSHLAPGQCSGIPGAQDRIILAIDVQVVFVRPDVPVPSPVNSVKFEQIRKIVSGNQIVDGDKIESRGLQQNLQRGAPDSAESVDGNVEHLCL